MKKIGIILTVAMYALMFSLPAVSLAAIRPPSMAGTDIVDSSSGGTFLGPVARLIDSLNALVAKVVPLLIACTIAVFFWGLVKYVMSTKDKASADNGKWLMMAGLGALFVMVSLWGIIRLVQSTFNIQTNATPNSIYIPASNAIRVN